MSEKSEIFTDEAARQAWQSFLANESNLGHVNRTADATDIESPILDSMQGARSNIARMKAHIGTINPLRILEVGSSAGFNSFALQEYFPNAEVFGIEPEAQAVEAAQSLWKNKEGRRPSFIQGVGESLPFPDDHFDLIYCHTVIEHVRDVPKVISEMGRVLSPLGAAYLEAPNYLWPYEPHLEIWTIPVFGKKFVKLCAHLQGKGAASPFLGHLQFVTPRIIETALNQNSLSWQNMYLDKIRSVLGGKETALSYKLLSKTLSCISNLFGTDNVVRALGATGMHPSLIYIFRTRSPNV